MYAIDGVELPEGSADRPAVPVSAPRLGRKATAGAVVLAYLTEQAEAIRAGEPAVRRDEPDAVHQMRVATRRMRSALQAYGKVIDRSATRELTAELKWLAGVLGDARDLEVLHARFDHSVDGLPDELVVGPVRARLTRYFAGREADARTAAIAALDSDRYQALLAAIDGLLAEPPLTRLARGRARRELPALIGRAYRRVDGHVRQAAHLSGDDRDVEWHEGRKAAKRLRYAGEAAAPVLGAPAKRLVKRTKQVQEVLGDHQDAVVARPVLREIGMQAYLDGENGFSYGLLYEREAAGMRLVASEVEAAFRSLRRSTRKVTA
jgi:CHAD domain-containing protein